MDTSQASSREYQQQAIDAEVKSLEESIRALRRRRNTLAPISALPTEVITVIFSFLRVPVKLLLIALLEVTDPLAWLRVTHVCHHWREIALHQPLFWSHVNFTTFNSAGAAEILARANKVPLYLEARVPIGHWDGARFSAFQKELQACVSHIRHLAISAEYVHLRKTLDELVSSAPTLEYLALCCNKYGRGAIFSRVFVPDILFDGTTPRLSCLELRNCAISWESPLLKGLRNLEIHKPSADARPGLSVWLGALDKMPQLKTLTLHTASPIAPPGSSLPSSVERTVTLPSLTRLNITASVSECGLALAHLDLPALTQLEFKAKSCRRDGTDVQEILPHVARHAHGPQDTQPLQSVVVRSNRTCADMLVWAIPDIDVKLYNPAAFIDAMFSVRVAFSVECEDWSPATHAGVFDAAMAALPMDGLVTLTSQNRTSPLNKQSWLRHAPRWPLLQRVRLATPAAHGFREMLLEENGGRECPLLPLLTKLVLVDTALSARRTLRLCDALMKRVKQGVPLETLELHTRLVTSRAIELLSEIVVDVVSPETNLQTKEQPISTWDSGARGLFVEDDSSGVEDYDEDDSNSGSDDEVLDDWETGGDGGGYGEDEMDYW
ncbi:hypothetical protein EDB92DRAFT_1851946 [Lactarius akahatsu]|uniref:F-box domain-containing protein n=1 Tax=Lactarius akahatsu TaxID=416441 RepID=A0AAD4QEP8_9AGAM|nr:hypothetical protein EDB92DRAFT_1851946 [Lactarius akahatsu]